MNKTITGGTGKHLFRAKFTDGWAVSIWYYFKADQKEDVYKLAEDLGFFQAWERIEHLECLR